MEKSPRAFGMHNNKLKKALIPINLKGNENCPASIVTMSPVSLPSGICEYNAVCSEKP